jgi:hypothetical protein
VGLLNTLAAQAEPWTALLPLRNRKRFLIVDIVTICATVRVTNSELSRADTGGCQANTGVERDIDTWKVMYMVRSLRKELCS